MVAKFNTIDTSPDTIAALKRIANSDKSISLIINENSIIVSQNLGHSDNVDLKVNNHQMTVKSDGHFSLNDSMSKLRYTIKDKGTSASSGVVSVHNSRINIVNKISYSKMIENMDSMDGISNDDSSLKDSSIISVFSSFVTDFMGHTVLASNHYAGQINGQLVKTGTHVHRNRYNGSISNHRYYSRLRAQGWVNYYKSDCYRKHAAYSCPFTKPDKKCDSLSKTKPHDCSSKGHWSIKAWFRNKLRKK